MCFYNSGTVRIVAVPFSYACALMLHIYINIHKITQIMQKYSKNRVDKGIFMQYYTVILNDFNLQEDIYYEKDDGDRACAVYGIEHSCLRQAS